MFTRINLPHGGYVTYCEDNPQNWRDFERILAWCKGGRQKFEQEMFEARKLQQTAEEKPLKWNPPEEPEK